YQGLLKPVDTGRHSTKEVWRHENWFQTEEMELARAKHIRKFKIFSSYQLQASSNNLKYF
ncbi:Hypothetical predicted protein, partial [Olea europaea subsp. europaea]